MAIVKRIESAEAGHEDKPSGCYARNKIEAEEQPFPIDINVTVLLVPLSLIHILMIELSSEFSKECYSIRI